jgi:hypothetical protein
MTITPTRLKFFRCSCVHLSNSPNNDRCKHDHMISNAIAVPVEYAPAAATATTASHAAARTSHASDPSPQQPDRFLQQLPSANNDGSGLGVNLFDCPEYATAADLAFDDAEPYRDQDRP